MGTHFHHRGAGATHVEYLDVRPVLMERAHIIWVARVERDT